jgi:hypothetical protein
MLEPLRQTHADSQTFKEAIGISGSQEIVVFGSLSKVVLTKKEHERRRGCGVLSERNIFQPKEFSLSANNDSIGINLIRQTWKKMATIDQVMK